MHKIDSLFLLYDKLGFLHGSPDITATHGTINPYVDSDVGHFCAPEISGFCEANLCIFHSTAAKRHNVQVVSKSVLDLKRGAENFDQR